MSNRGELSSRNFAAVDSPNMSSEAQAIVDKYLQSQKDLADRAKKKYTDSQSARKWGNNTMQNGKGMPDHFQNSRNMNNNATDWKCRWLGKSPVYRDTERECNKKNNENGQERCSVQGSWEKKEND